MSPPMRIDVPEANIRLPNISHHFSTIVFREGAGEKKYYELSPLFHGRYRSSDLFRIHWYTWTRVTSTAEKAVKLRTERVLRRANVQVRSFDYMAVVHTLDKKGQVRKMRHVSSVTVSEVDFELLLGKNHILPVPVAESEEYRMEKLRAVVQGLTPLASRVA